MGKKKKNKNNKPNKNEPQVVGKKKGKKKK